MNSKNCYRCGGLVSFPKIEEKELCWPCIIVESGKEATRKYWDKKEDKEDQKL